MHAFLDRWQVIFEATGKAKMRSRKCNCLKGTRTAFEFILCIYLFIALLFVGTLAIS